MFNDSNWLGEQAELGPSARAGVGILLAHGHRFLPIDSQTARRELERAVPGHGVALWDHASRVLAADQWLEPSLAILIAQAFRAVAQQAHLRIRVSKTAWSQNDDAVVGAIVADLGRAVGEERAFAEWPGRASVPLPKVDHRATSALIVAGSGDIVREAPKAFGSLTPAQWQPDALATDLFITSSSDGLLSIAPTVMAIVVGVDASDVLANFLRSRERHRARCLVHVPVEAASSEPWVKAFLSAWDQSARLIDEALKIANDETGITARIVASTQTFILQSSRYLRPEEYESHDLMNYSAPSPSEDLLEDSVSRHAAGGSGGGQRSNEMGKRSLAEQQPQSRVLDVRLLRGSDLIRRLPASGLIEILVDIRPQETLDGDRQVFPDDEVRWGDDAKIFQIHLLELGAEPVTRNIKVPRYGRSDSARFHYEIRDGHIDLRFIVSSGLRILQTARLQGDPGDWIKFKVESIAAPISEQERKFDVALLVNDSLGGRPSITSLTPDGIELSPLTDTQAGTARDEMLAILERAVVNPKAPTADVLLQLASHGRLLLEHLECTVQGWPDTIERVQLTTQSDAFFPMEYLYKGPIPENADHGICPQSKDCLSRGEAISSCPIRAATTQLCPMGFLGLTAVIERQTWHSGHSPGIWLALPQDVETRAHITDLKRALFAASDRADSFTEDPSAAGPKPLRTAAIVEALECNRPKSWNAWKNEINNVSPSLLLLVIHIENNYLHIEGNERLILGSISEEHVGSGHPIAIAIGCSSGQSKMVGAGLPAVLMKRGARVVISAMTDVLGRHANKATLDLALALRAAVATPGALPIAIGELMTKLRRDLLAADIALGLSLVAYGDADIALAPPTL